MNYIVDLIKKNVKFLIIMLSIILIGVFGVTYAIRIGNAALIGVNISTSNVDVDITYDNASDENIISTGKMMPIEDNLVTYNSTDDRIVKNKFYVTGKSTNPDNTIYDIALHDVNIDCELRTQDLKWKLFKNGVELSGGNMSPTFDSMDDNRLVLTNIQEDLTNTRVEYVFVMWVSESCTGDIKTCNKDQNQNKFLGKNISASIKLELTTKSKKELVRTTGNELSCSYISVGLPTSNILTYNGQTQTFFSATSGYSLLNNTGIDAGTYAVTLKLNDGYKWDDNSTENKILNYKIDKREIVVTASDQNITYGSTINNNAYNVSNLVSGHRVESLSLDASINKVGTGIITPSAIKIVDSNGKDVTNNYSISYKEGNLNILCNNISTEPSVNNAIYNGERQIGVSGGSYIELGGVTAAIQPGDYIANATPSKNYCWSDYSKNKKNYDWSIGSDKLRVQLSDKTTTYNGSVVDSNSAVVTTPDGDDISSSVTVNYQYYSGAYCDNNLKIIGKPTNAGIYSVKATASGYNNYDGNTSNCATITINKLNASFSLNSSFGNITYGQSDTRTYTITPSNANVICGSELSATATCSVNKTNNTVTVNGTGVGTTYINIVVGDDMNYRQNRYSFPVSIVCSRTATGPTTSNKTYNAQIQTGVTGGSNVTLGGTISATNAGNYIGTASPKANYCWSDGTTTTKNYNWKIDKAQSSCSFITVPELEFPDLPIGTITYSCTGDGSISVSSSNTSVITVNQSTKTNSSVELNAINKGTSTITLTQADGNNYLGTSINTDVQSYASDYTIEYYLGNNTSTSGATRLGTSTCSIHSECSLNSWSSLNGTVPFSDKGWSFAGWSTSTNDTTVNYTDGEIISSATGGNVIKLYAVFKRNIINYSGINKATSKTSTQYYNPYCYDTTNCTSNYSTHSVPTPASISGWTYLGATVGTSATSEYFTGNGHRGPNEDPTYYSVYSREISIAYNSNGGTGTISNSTATQKYNSANNVETVTFILKNNSFTNAHYSSTVWGDSPNPTMGINAGSSYSFSPGVSDSTTKTFYALWTPNKAIVKFSTNGGDILSSQKYNDTTTYNWSRDLSTNNGLISRSNANGTTMSPVTQTYTYGTTSSDLNNWNSSTYMNISKLGYQGTSGAQWKCLSGNCVSTNYSQTETFTSESFCDTSNGNCEVVLGVNWTGNTYTINFYNGNHTSTPGATKIGTKACTYGTDCTLTTWSSLGGTLPFTDVGWSFYGWTTATNGTSRTYTDGQSVNSLTSDEGGTINLYAIFKRNITFYSGISKASSSNVVQYFNPYCYDTTNCRNYYTITDFPTAASISGWTYAGYAVGTSATSTVYTVNYRRDPAGNNASYAIYERTVSVAYNANGGSGTMSNTTGTTNQKYTSYGAVSSVSITLSSNSFSRSGYKFKTWGTSSTATTGTNAGSAYSFSNAVDAGATKTLYAVWTGNSYTINFYRGKHTATPGATKLGSVSCTYGTSCTLTTWSDLGGTVPVSGVGWSFYGWTTSSSSTDRSYSNGASVSNLTATDGGTVSLYAIFRRTITFYSGIAKASSTTSYQYYNPYCFDTDNCTSYYTSNAIADLAAPASISGWTYLGYTSGTSATSTYYANSVKRGPASDPYYYAVYDRSVSIAYNANGGSGSMSNTSASTKQLYNSYGAISSVDIKLKSNSFTYSGYTFKAWGTGSSSTSGTEGGGTYSFSNAVGSSATKTLYAIWKKTITITFDKNTAYSIGSESKTCTLYSSASSCSITSPSISVGYGSNKWSQSYSDVFTAVGFSTSSTATTSSWDASTAKNVSANATYYAITKFNGSGKTFTNPATSGSSGLNVRSTAASSGNTIRGALSDGCTLTISKGKYVSTESTYKMWFNVTGYKNGTCTTSNCSGWVAAYYVKW